jgi:long-chain acyl-CoA synthetase
MADLRTMQSLTAGLDQGGERPAVFIQTEDGFDQASYARFARDVHALARGLAARGLDRDRPVGLMAPTGYPALVAALGVLASGAVIMPMDIQMEGETLGHVIRDSGARLFLTTADLAAKLEKNGQDADLEFIRLDVDQGEESWRGLMAADPGAGDQDDGFFAAEPEHTAALFYTSGTTGRPKGVPLSHANLVYQLNTLHHEGLIDPRARVLLPLPMHHVYPFVIAVFTPLVYGASIVLPAALTGPKLAQAMSGAGVTHVAGVPRLHQALMSAVESRLTGAASLLFSLCVAARRRLGLRLGKTLLPPLHARFGKELAVMASGGSLLDEELALKLEALGWKVVIGYGLTETSPILTFNLPGDMRLGSIGRAMPGTDIRVDTSVPSENVVRGAAANRPESSQQGELLVRGPGVFSGYKGLPDKTAESFTEDGWFRTGDLGFIDADGYVYLTGRASTLIVTPGGENIQPRTVESAYAAHPLIAEAGVFQDTDGRLKGVMVPDLAEFRRQDRDDLQEGVRRAVEEVSRELPSYQRLSEVQVSRREIERTRLGKIRRHLLPERFHQQRRGEGPAASGPMPVEEMNETDREILDNPRARTVWDWLADRYKNLPLSPDTSPQLDLGVDSLEWVNITMEISQRAGVELDEDALGRVNSVRDLLGEVAWAKEDAGERFDPLEEPYKAIPEEKRYWLKRHNPAMFLVGGLFYHTARLLVRLLFGVRGGRIQGEENLRTREQIILAPNHESYVDAFVVSAPIGWRRAQKFYWAGWSEIIDANALLRFGSRLGHAVPVMQDKGPRTSLAFGAAVLQRGDNLVWFPEGARSRNGELQEFKPGIGMLLQHYPVKVVPVCIEGSFEAWPPDQTLPRPRPVRVRYHEPVSVQELEDLGQGDNRVMRVTDGLKRIIARMKKDMEEEG